MNIDMNSLVDLTVLRNARNKAEKLRNVLGGPPPVDGICPERDSCDVCRQARMSSKAYMSYVYAGFEIDGLISRIVCYSDMESRMSLNPSNSKSDFERFYISFTDKYDSEYKKAEDKIRDQIERHGWFEPEEDQ